MENWVLGLPFPNRFPSRLPSRDPALKLFVVSGSAKKLLLLVRLGEGEASLSAKEKVECSGGL